MRARRLTKQFGQFSRKLLLVPRTTVPALFTRTSRPSPPRLPGAMSDGEADNGEPADARDLFAWLSREVHELVSHVPRVHGAPSPIQFLREFVSANRPVVVTDAFNDWPAMERWSLDYLADAMGDTKISVNVTPDGRGDALLSTRGWTVSGTGDGNTR